MKINILMWGLTRELVATFCREIAKNLKTGENCEEHVFKLK